jgi:hypothetical protein
LPRLPRSASAALPTSVVATSCCRSPRGAARRPTAFDILFNELDVNRPEHDAAFAAAVERNLDIWLAMTHNDNGQVARMRDMPASVGAVPLTTPPHPANSDYASSCSIYVIFGNIC